MKVLEVIFIITGICLFIVFLSPVFFAGILNFGNVVGMLISAALFIYGMFFQNINCYFNKLWNTNSGKFLLVFLLFVISVVLTFVFVSTFSMFLAAHRKPKGETTVVILGCQINPDGPSLMLEERLNAALSYLAENKNIKCVLSGGQGKNEIISEAQGMYNWLTERGIDGERLYIEDKSTTTRENLIFSKKVIEENGLNPKMTIITNDFHQYRASLLAKSLDIEHYSISGKSVLVLLPTYYIRELGGILKEQLVNFLR